MSQPTEDQYRPPKEQRWTEGMRTEPVRVAVRTEWRYTSDSEGSHPYGRGPWPFSRGGYVTESDVPGPYKSSSQDLEAHLHRAISAFGDDKNLVVEVRPADADPTDAEVEALAMGMWKHSGEERCWDEVAEQWLHLARVGLRSMRDECRPNTPNAPNDSGEEL